MGSLNDPAVDAFISLNIIGLILFSLIVISALIAQLRGGSRHATFFNFCFAWIIFCISYSLMYLAGQKGARPPDHALCVAQSALVYSAPLLASSATITLVTHLMINILMVLATSPDKIRSSLISVALVIFPWVIWMAVFVGVLFFGINHATLVQLSPNGTFCVLAESNLPKLTSIWATIACTVLVAEEVIIGILLYRHRDVFSGVSQSFTMAIRMGIFSILGLAGIGVALVYTITKHRGIQFDILIAAISPAAAIIFGSQKDILRVWIFWKTYQPEPVSEAISGSAVLSTILSSRVTVSSQPHDLHV